MFQKMKNLIYQKSFLMGLLFLALGSSLSWNPEYFSIARYEYIRTESAELAQQAPTAAASMPKSAEILIKEFEISTLSNETFKIKKGRVIYTVSPKAEKNTFSIGFLLDSYVPKIEGSFTEITVDGNLSEDNKLFAKIVERIDARISETKAEPARPSVVEREAYVPLSFSDRSGDFYRSRGCDSKDSADLPSVLECQIKELKRETKSCVNEANRDAKEKKTAELVEQNQQRNVWQTLLAQLEKELNAVEKIKKTKENKESLEEEIKTRKSDIKELKDALAKIKREIKNKKPEPDYTECKSEAQENYNSKIKSDLFRAARSYYGTDGFNAYLQSVGELMGLGPLMNKQMANDIFNTGFKGMVSQADEFCSPNTFYGGFNSGFNMNINAGQSLSGDPNYLGGLKAMAQNGQSVGCMKSLMSNLAPVVDRDLKMQMMNTIYDSNSNGDRGFGIKIGTFNGQQFAESYFRNFSAPSRLFMDSSYANNGNSADFLAPYNVRNGLGRLDSINSSTLGVGSNVDAATAQKIEAARVEAAKRGATIK